MLAKIVYVNRRNSLIDRMRKTGESGIALFLSNIEVPSQGSADCNGYDFVNYSKFESYYDFGGLRLKDDVLVTETGARRLGTHRLPIQPDDVEEAMAY